MKKQMICGVCVLTSFMLLGEPLSVYAAELNGKGTQVTTDNTEDLLTAGAGNLFISPLTKVEYVEIAKNAEGALWGYTHLGICNVSENNLNIRKEPDESGKLVGKLPKNAACEIISTENGWAYIKSGKIGRAHV